MTTIRQDVRFGLRTLARRPAFTAVAILALSLGIGANTAIFSVVNAVLLRPLPYGSPDRLAMVWLDNRRLGLHEDLMSYPIFEDWKKNSVFEEMAPFSYNEVTLTGGEEPERVEGVEASAAFFSVMGARPLLGRVFLQEEEQPGRDAVAVLSYGLWMRRFGGDASVVGKTFEANGKTLTVAGVMPPEFRFPSKNIEIWTPLALRQELRETRFAFWMYVAGRLKPGVSWDRARSEMSAIGGGLEQQYPEMAGYGVWLTPLREQLTGKVRLGVLVLSGAVVFVLLIACANVANLLLARAASREREMAVRAALGASRLRLVRQLLTESLLLSAAAGAMGLVLAVWCTSAITALAPRDLPGLDDIRIDGLALAFTLAVSLLTGAIFGVMPALEASRSDLNESLKESGRALTSLRGGRTRALLVVGEVALAVVLVSGAGLLIRSFLFLRGVDPGYRTDNATALRISVGQNQYPERQQVAALYRDALERIRRIPGVASAGAVSDFMLSSTPSSGSFTIEGRAPVPAAQQIEATIDSVTPGFFEALSVPLIKGRLFTGADGEGSPAVVIINQEFARRYWPDQNPVGARFHFGRPRPNPNWLTIVGVVGDMRRQGLEKQARCESFVPQFQRPRREMTLIVRGAGDTAGVIGPVRREVRNVNPNLPLYGVRTIEELLGESVAQRRFQMWLLGVLAGLALTLAAIGIYGVMHYAVAQRTQEIGVRMALGARGTDVLRMVLMQGGVLAGTGLLAGLAASWGLTRWMESLLYGVRPSDPLTFAAVATLLGAVALTASYVPARRAARVDPVVALRHE